MKLFLTNPIVLLTLTFGTYYVSQYLQAKSKWVLLNPVLLTITVIICFLKWNNIDYEIYNEAGQYIEFWLKPAVVALGVPLYLQLEKIKKQLWPLFFCQLAGCVAGIISATIIAKLLGASHDVIISIAPKSVTTPIAMEITRSLNGIPSLTAAVVVIVGIFGALTGFYIMEWLKVDSPIAQGISLGTAAHALGTSCAMNVSSKYGAFASLGLILNGILTSILTPPILRLMDPWFIS